MNQYVGLDVSLKETSVCVLDVSGRVVWRGECKATPEGMATVIRKRASEAKRVVLESGTLSTRHWHELKEFGIPVVCVSQGGTVGPPQQERRTGCGRLGATGADGLARRGAGEKLRQPPGPLGAGGDEADAVRHLGQGRGQT